MEETVEIIIWLNGERENIFQRNLYILTYSFFFFKKNLHVKIALNAQIVFSKNNYAMKQVFVNSKFWHATL